MASSRKAMAFSSLNEALRALAQPGSRAVDKKEAVRYITEMASDPKRAATALTKAGRWEEVVRTALTYVQDEIRNTKSKRAQQDDVGLFLLGLVRRAPLQDGAWPLVAQAETLVTDALLRMDHAATAGSALQLLELVLKEAKYCEGLSRRLAERCLYWLMRSLEDDDEEGGGLGPASVTRAKALANLMANYRRDFALEGDGSGGGGASAGGNARLVRAVVRFAGKWAGRHGIAEARKAGVNVFPDVAEEVLATLNALLLKHGVDCAPHLAMGGQDQDVSYGEAVLNLALQCCPHLHASKLPTFLEHLRLQLHLARARLALAHPWALDPGDYVSLNLDKMWEVALQDCVSNAGQHARATVHGAGGRKGRGETWLPLEYRERLTLVLAAEVLFAMRAQKATSKGGGREGGRRRRRRREEGGAGSLSRGTSLEDEGGRGGIGRGGSSTQANKRLRLERTGSSMGSVMMLGGSGANYSYSYMDEQDPMDRIREALGAAFQGSGGSSGNPALGRGLSSVSVGGEGGGSTQATATQGGGGGTQSTLGGSIDRGGGLNATLAHLQVLTAVLENLPVGGEAWVLDDNARGEGLLEMVGLLEGVLASRGEGVLLMWAVAALLALAQVCTRRPAVISSSTQLRTAWSSVLHTLLRPDLKCWSATGRLDVHGLGLREGVLRLLTVMVRHPSLLGDADLARAQDQLWGLPAFHTVQDSAGPLGLLHALLRRGEVLDGPDGVASRLSSSLAVMGGSSGTRVPCGFLEQAPVEGEWGDYGGGGGGEGGNDGGAAAAAQRQRRSLPQPGSRVERVGDFLMAWVCRQLLLSRASVSDRSRAISRALAALVDLVGASRYQLMLPSGLGLGGEEIGLSSSSFTVGELKWSLTSPWRALAEQQGRRQMASLFGAGGNEADSSSTSSSSGKEGQEGGESGAVRVHFCLHGERNLWRGVSTTGSGEAGTSSSSAAAASVSGAAAAAAAAVGASIYPRGFSPALQGVTVSGGTAAAGVDVPKVCSAGGQPLQRRRRGGAGGGGASLSGSAAAQVGGVALRVVRHLEAWTEAACTSLFGSSNGGTTVAIGRGTSTQSTVSALSLTQGAGAASALSEEGARVALLLLVKTMFVLLAVKIDRATVEAGDDEDDYGVLDPLEDLPSGLPRIVPVATRVEELFAKLGGCLQRLPWPRLESNSRRRGGGGGGGGADPKEVAEAGAMVLDVLSSLLEDLPLTFAGHGGGGLEQVGLWVESGEGGAGGGRREEENLPREARSVMWFFRERVDEALKVLLPRGSGEVTAGGGGGGRGREDEDEDEDEEDEDDLMDDDEDEASSLAQRRLYASRTEDDMLMGDSDEEDDEDGARRRQRTQQQQRRGRGGLRGGSMRRGDCALAYEIASIGRFSARELAAWARVALVVSPTNVQAHRFVKAANCLLLDEPGLDIAGLWYDALFLLADPEDYVTHLAELQRWVHQDPPAVANSVVRASMSRALSGSNTGDGVTVGQEIRLHHLWRLLQQLGSRESPGWLVEGLAPVQDRLWSSFELVGREELSWYNRCLETDTRKALFEVSEAVRGDNATRKLFLACLVHSSRHGDSEVRLSTSRALPAVFAVYPNSLSVWEQYRRQGVLSGPGEGPDADEAAGLASPPPITSSQTAPLPVDPLQRRLGQLMAFGTAARASDKVTRVAVLALCRWWGAPAGAAAAGSTRSGHVITAAARARAARVVEPMVEAVLSSVAVGLGYPSTAALLQEHLIFLMHEWLVVLRLPLREFPLHLVLLGGGEGGGAQSAALAAGAAATVTQGGGRRGEGGGTSENEEDGGDEEDDPSAGSGADLREDDEEETEEDAAARQERLLGAFVRHALRILVPLACLACGGYPPTYRFELLDSLAVAAGPQSQGLVFAMNEGGGVLQQQPPVVPREGRMAELVETHMVELKALELLLLTAATMHDAAATQLADLQAFLRRSLPKAKEEDLESGLGFDVAEYPQDVVVAMLDLLGPEPPAPPLPSSTTDNSALHTLTPTALGPALQALAERVLGAPRLPPATGGEGGGGGGEEEEEATRKVDLTVLWSQCNPVELLLHLKVRLAQANSPARARRLLELTKELLMVLGPAAQEPAVLHLGLHLLLWALERHPDALTLPGLDLLETYLDAALTGSGSSSSSSSSSGAERLGPHLGALVVSLFTVLVRLRSQGHQLRGGGGGATEAEEEEELLCGGSLLLLSSNSSTPSSSAALEAVGASSLFSEEEAKTIAAKVVGLLKRLVIEERGLKPYLAGLDPLPRLGGGGWVGEEEEEVGLEEVRKAIARATASITTTAGLLRGGTHDEDGQQQLIAHAKRFAATLAKSAGQGRAGQVTRLVALKALLARLSPISATTGQLSSQRSPPRDPGPEVRRLLVPALLALCRGGGGGERGGAAAAAAGAAGFGGGENDASSGSPEETAVRIDAARALGALGAVPPCELVLWAPSTNVGVAAATPPVPTPTTSSKKSSSSRRSSGAASPTPTTLSSPATPCQATVGKALKILLGLVTGSDSRAVQLAVETLRATLLRPMHGTEEEEGGSVGCAPLACEIRPWMEAVWTSGGQELGFEAQDADLLRSFARSSTKHSNQAADAVWQWRQREAEEAEAAAASSLSPPLKRARAARAAYVQQQRPGSSGGSSSTWWSRRVWDPRRWPYEQWITQLVWTLVREGIMAGAPAQDVEDGLEDDEVVAVRRFLIQCGGACRCQPALAEAVLPLVLLCLLRLDPDPSLTKPPDTGTQSNKRGGWPQQQPSVQRVLTREQAGQKLTRCLQRCLPRAGPRPLQTLIAALTFLRTQSIHEALHHPSLSSSGGSKTPRRRGAAASDMDLAARPLKADEAVAAVGGMMGLGLDKLEVARAALRCGALTAAALYLELHVEDDRQLHQLQAQHPGGGGGSSKKKSSSSSGGVSNTFSTRKEQEQQQEQEQAALLMDEVGEVRSLLLRISGRLAEPDGAEGVQAGTGLEGRTRAAAARESPDWRQALAAHDCLVLQRTQGGSGSGAGVAVGGGGGGGGSGVSAGPAIALQKLDLGHVLGSYLAGLETRTQASHEAALRELEFETSWRACRWQKLAVGGSSGGSGSASSSALRGPDAFVARHHPPSSSAASSSSSFSELVFADATPPLELDDDYSLRAWHREGRAEEDLVGGPALSLLGRQRYHEHVHAGLRALAARDHAGLAHYLRAARLGLLSCLAQEVPSEPSRFLSPVLARLQSLREMEEVAALRVVAKGGSSNGSSAMAVDDDLDGTTAGGGESSLAESSMALGATSRGMVRRGEAQALIAVWRARSRGALGDDFELVEPVLAVREVLLRALCPPLDARQALVRHARGLAGAARAAGNLTIAASVMDRVESLLLAPGASTPGALTVDRCACKLEQARILWARGEADLAIRTAAALGPALEALERTALVVEPRTRGIEVQARQLAGRWMALARSEGTQRIIDGHLRPAVERAVSEGGTPTQRRRAHLTLGNFLAELYQRRSDRLKSEEMVRQAELLRQRKAELEATQREYEGVGEKDPKRGELRRRIGSLRKELALDEADYKAQADSLSGLLLDALRQFRLALCLEGLLGGGEGGGGGGGRRSSRDSHRSARLDDADGEEGEEDDVAGDDNDDDLGPVFRVVALWFEPANAGNPAVNAEMAQFVAEVPTYKLLPLIYQILSRLGSGTPEFNKAVEVLVLRICQEHPHHTLLQLYALRHGKRLKSAAARETYNRIPQLEEKVQAAQGILDRLVASGNPILAALVKNTERLLDGYIALASVKRTQEMKDTRNMAFAAFTGEPALVRSFPDILRRGAVGPSSGAAHGTNNGVVLAALPAVVTKTPRLDPLARYDVQDQDGSSSSSGTHVARVERFESRFMNSDSGLSRPMIIACLGSDGRRYRQVVKADDVRSDAIMMQVFETMNTLLCRDPRARRRALHIRTYRVVPLTPELGVLEFVEDTKTLGGVSVALHERYNGEADWSSKECRDKLRNARTSEERREAYQNITQNFHPAFRFFFLENFPDPALWYRKRLHYTRSVAVSSIVGYVLGIGDRHASNILVDQATAGLVHIDFGYTFEQGKILPQPETVPFRLTRDVVDAMGVTGTEGVFRQCCNTTMAVLRQHAPSLLTILEVCVHDPLHSWVRAGVPQVSAAGGGSGEAAGTTAAIGGGGGGGGKGGGAGDGGDEEEEEEGSGRRRRKAAHKVVGGDEPRKAAAAMETVRPTSDAERALLRIRQKLKGYEDPGGDAMSVEGHVKYLISEATDPDNLCRIFVGWSPWL